MVISKLNGSARLLVLADPVGFIAGLNGGLRGF